MQIRRCTRNCKTQQRLRRVRNLPWSVVRFPGREEPRSVGTAEVAVVFPPRRLVRHTEGTICSSSPIDSNINHRDRLANAGKGEGHRGQRQRTRRAGDRAPGRASGPCLLRLTPSAAVATSGPAGSLTEVRIRGAEANHTLLFIDGIRANDPATGNVPRFELLNADLASRIEVVRGPQSALWGSEAIGGVVAVETAPPADRLLTASAEAGSFGFGRASAAFRARSEMRHLSLGLGWQRARGIDSFDGSGDRDGYRNLSGRASGSWSPNEALELGAAGFALTGRSQFDGFDPITFVHADTLDSSRNRLAAGRLWARFGKAEGDLERHALGNLLSAPRTAIFSTSDEINRTSGQRSTLGGQIEHRFKTGAIANTLIVALDHESRALSCS